MLGFAEQYNTEKAQNTCKMIPLKWKPKGKPGTWVTLIIRALENTVYSFSNFLNITGIFTMPIVYRLLCRC